MTLPFALAPNGLPLGIQLTAAPLHERLLLEAATAVEKVIGFQAKPDLS
jgi:Asp-tRNA(Asn)/Glu-tRNA(Gln) amidotransferase A subunit family amidase